MNRANDIKKLSHFLDSKFSTPLGRVGWDGIIGLVPGVGDVLTSVLSFYVILRAAQMGCPPILLVRMAGNVLIENVIDTIPLVGNLFDFFWKSNTKNVNLIERYIATPHLAVRRSWGAVGLVLVLIFIAIAGVITTGIYFLSLLYHWITTNYGAF